MNITPRVPKTKQQVFDKVVAHLLAQDQTSMHKSACVYRTPEGLMCAVGCLIPDELYLSEMEGELVGRLLASHPELQELFDAEVLDSNLLDRLQSCHDVQPVSEWPSALRHIASTHELTLPKELQ